MIFIEGFRGKSKKRERQVHNYWFKKKTNIELMNYICLDTCTWIYLANGTEPVKLLDFILDQVKKDNITILLPMIIIDEWERNKFSTVEKTTINQFDKITKELNRIAQLFSAKRDFDRVSFLLGKDNEEVVNFEEFIKRLKKKKEDVRKAINDNIKKIDEIFLSNATVKINIEDKIKLLAGEFALQKKAPFKEKNSFADALILFSFIDYLISNEIKGASFISYNTNDFCEKKDNKKSLHPDLEHFFSKSDSKFFKTLGEAINQINKDIISKEELDRVKEIQAELEFDREFETCQSCLGNHRRHQVISFGEPIEIYNEYMYVDSEKYLPKDQSVSVNSIQLSDCSYCGTAHFKCQKCLSVNELWEDEYDFFKECEGCGTKYKIVKDVDRKGMEVGIDFSIEIDREKCNYCGDQFIDLNKTETCAKCEQEFNNK